MTKAIQKVVWSVSIVSLGIGVSAGAMAIEAPTKSTQTLDSESISTTATQVERLPSKLEIHTDITQNQSISSSLETASIAKIADATIANNSEPQLDVSALEATEGMAQVTSVSQLSDVQPTDWAFQALQSLVERYGCIVGYPDQTYRGNRAISRYEFAAGVNACLDRVNELIAAGTTGLATKEDLATLQKLQEEFAAELATLRGRVDALEARTTELEANQFSTTTKLNGEIIFNVASVFGDEGAINSDQERIGAARGDLDENPIGSYRARLNFLTSFNGKDRLLTRLESNNTTQFGTAVSGTNMTRLGYDTGTADNDILLGKLNYRFLIGKKLDVIVDAIAGEYYANFYTFNPFFENPANGALSRFGRFSPIYRTSNSGSGQNFGSGVSFVYKFSDSLSFGAGYLARRANDPVETRGLFDGSYSAIAQLNFRPIKNLDVGLTYSHAYFSGINNDVAVSGAYGSGFANQPFGAGLGSTGASPRGIATTANYYGLQASYRLSPSFAISGWGLYTEAIAEDGEGVAAVNRGDKADIWSWAVTLAFLDVGKKGNLAGLIFGQPPKVTDNDYGPTATGAQREDDDTSYHLEGLFRFQVNDNISITPGIIVIFNPEHNSNNDTVFVGALRTTFRF
jgi:predicted PhzF superfamily epimerase YddE/YHI9